jgi:hypothetical protein
MHATAVQDWATDVIDPVLLAATEAIGPTPEGKTERQKIPIRLHSLAWLVWIIGRPVGWNRYYKLPDLKIMRAGWGEFEAMAAGLAMAATLYRLGQM